MMDAELIAELEQRIKLLEMAGSGHNSVGFSDITELSDRISQLEMSERVSRFAEGKLQEELAALEGRLAGKFITPEYLLDVIKGIAETTGDSMRETRVMAREGDDRIRLSVAHIAEEARLASRAQADATIEGLTSWARQFGSGG